ncbi:MAG TPA: dehydrogenase E1 component subunit alpha/beta [Bryobacteraceae bacterium]|nr:dehydrogenase E1 component subunit alpha/beta [Bryobacteraceae bacterium]
MLTRTAAAGEPGLGPSSLRQLDRATLIQALRVMRMSRRIDDKEVLLKRQNRIYFQVSGAGHEAIQTAAGLYLRPGFDWFYPYYRDRALALACGITPQMMMLQAVGSGEDTQSGGRQMPSHWSSRELHVVTGSSPTGSQYVQAVGCAHAGRLLYPESDEVTLVSSGEGATSEGEFWEAINAACLEKLPIIFVVEDNGFAISVPVEHQTPGGSISKLLSGFPSLLRLEVNGSDFVASWKAMEEAAAHCRAGIGPALVHAHCIRPYSHSLSDDERSYKTEAERAEESQRDPLLLFPAWLRANGYADEEEIAAIYAEVEREVESASEYALQAGPPDLGTALRFLYSPAVDPTSPRFAAEPSFTGEPRTMVDSINLTLAHEMARDPRVVVFGEDVADCSREDNLGEVKGKGGVFKATLGLQRQFGSKRCFNTPIAEACIAGRAIGMSTRGMKPVAEIQFFDYIWPAMMQIRDEMANIRWRSNNGFSCPAVLRVPIGGYLTGGSIYHSQCGEVEFTHIPGLRVVFPSNALDAVGLLRTAIRCDDPVLFLEHKKLYREPYNRSAYPGPDFTIPFGKARTVRSGSHLTIVTYGALVQKSLTAAQQIETRHPGKTVEILDLRSLSPYDWEAIAASVRKTSRVLVAYEDMLSWGYGAELAARIADELFEYLDAPVKRVAAKDTWVAYSPLLEDHILPQVDDLVRAGVHLLSY